ncbi:type I-E CRISPR-associated protein Cas6/Cse3/CasE [Specibacter cremeus]|uniref:type I-E CRISPR-associated protein Cas6/Cse3/CasE n=1 Tax=Specibacter cremeus TaxID=1629051 RepID=UPI000F78178E|nr:type I-E CRISPR-associated protein Cas6/Cse3/CasE [Specibacter cremeus]
MYLSRFGVNPARRGARHLLGNPQAMHAAVLAGFPPETDRDAGRVLWRVDRDAHVANLYVLSPREPDFTHLVEQAGWATATWDTKDYRPLLDRLDVGQRWAFRLHANPVKQSADPAMKGKRLPHVTPAQQTQWLVDRAARNGFDLVADDAGEPMVEVSSRTRVAFGRKDPHHPGNKKPVTLARAQFDGVLSIADVDAFKSALTRGIGRGKAYGCGLMTIVKAG